MSIRTCISVYVYVLTCVDIYVYTYMRIYTLVPVL